VEFQNERLERMLIADEHAFQHGCHRVEIYGSAGSAGSRSWARCE
jgi:hypothetical protein